MLIDVDPFDGKLRWSQPISDTVYRSLVDVNGAIVYLTTRNGEVRAFDSLGAPIWQLDLEAPSQAPLMPLPGGGVVVYVDQQLIGLSASGEQLWTIDRAAPPFDWALNGDELIFTTKAEYPVVHRLDRSGHLIWAARVGGRPVVAGDQVFIYNPDGVYRLNPETLRADLLLALDPSTFEIGRAVATAEGGLIVAHRSSLDRRLIALNADGTLRWDRSVEALGRGLPRLLTLGGEVYAMTIDGDVLSIDTTSGDARAVFDGGSGTRLEGEGWAFATADGRLLFDFRSGDIIGLNLPIAFKAASGN
jgi:outer membrane protein assembly factor BamB